MKSSVLNRTLCLWRTVCEDVMLPKDCYEQGYRKFAPFVRQKGERKAQTCARGFLHQVQGLHFIARLAALIFALQSDEREIRNQVFTRWFVLR